MDLRTFFSNQNVQPNELNGMLAAVEKAIEVNNYETLGSGVVFGMSLGPTSPATVAVKVAPGVAYHNTSVLFPQDGRIDSASKRITLTTDVSKSLLVDYLGNPTAVAAGNERWLAIVAVPTRTNSDPRIDGSGTSLNFVNAESGDINIVMGNEDVIGTAGHPDAATVRGLGVLLGEVLIYHDTTAVSDFASFDLRNREQSFRYLQAITDSANKPQVSLFWQSERSAGNVIRAYSINAVSGGPPAGITITFGTYWDTAQRFWVADYAGPCMALRFQSNGFLFTQRTEGLSAGWADSTDGSWGDVTTPQDTDSMLVSALGLKVFDKAKSALFKSDGNVVASGGVAGLDNSGVTVCAVISQYAETVDVGINGQPPMAVWVPFPRAFATTPTQISEVNLSYSNGDGLLWSNHIDGNSDHDVNVDSYNIVPTPYGLYITVLPTLAHAYTRFTRFISVKA